MAKAARAGLGGVARRGAAQVKREERPPKRPDLERSRPAPWEPDRWEDHGVVREAAAAVTRGEQAGGGEPRPVAARRPAKLPAEVVAELVKVVGPSRAPRLEQRLDDAQRAFQRELYPEARRMLALLVRDAPAASAVRELNGLTLYRMGHWKAAAVELEAFRALTGSVEQNPVLADCYRALRRWAKADALWAELKATSPSAELVAEGRIVAAGALADRGDLAAAIALLEPAAAKPRVVREHHLRTWYALADLFDRAGDVGRARAMFHRIRAADGSFADVAERLAAIG